MPICGHKLLNCGLKLQILAHKIVVSETNYFFLKVNSRALYVLAVHTKRRCGIKPPKTSFKDVNAVKIKREQCNIMKACQNHFTIFLDIKSKNKKKNSIKRYTIFLKIEIVLKKIVIIQGNVSIAV